MSRGRPVRFLALCLLSWMAAPGAVAGESKAARSKTLPSFEAPGGIADLKAMERHLRGVVEKVRECTVRISGGSGVIVSREGLVLTVAHVGQRSGRRVTVTFPDGRRVRGETLGNDRGLDAGLVRIMEEGTWPFAEMGSSSDLKEGQWCLATGYPVSFRQAKAPVVRLGRVLRHSSSVVTTDCAIMGGDSGGPLFDLEGKVIGISSRCNQSVTRNFHVPVDVFRNSWTRLVRGDDFNSSERAYLGIAHSGGTETARISRVVPGSAAERAGLKEGDVIVRFDGKKLESYGDLVSLLRDKNPDDRVAMEVLRNGKTLKLTAKLGRRS